MLPCAGGSQLSCVGKSRGWLCNVGHSVHHADGHGVRAIVVWSGCRVDWLAGAGPTSVPHAVQELIC